MEAIVQYRDGVQFDVLARGHRIVTDQPVEANGGDAGMTPPELMLASLGTCAGHYAADYLRARSLPLDGLTVRVTADKALRPARLENFRIEVNMPGLEDARHQEGILRAVKHCLIHNTLLMNPSVDVGLKTSAPKALVA
jgi:putative redox protein